MNANQRGILGLAAILAWVGGGLAMAAQDQGLIQVKHHLTAIHQAGPMESGQLVLEVTNLSPAAVEDLYIQMELGSGALSVPDAIRLGRLDPSQLKVVSLPYHRPAPSGSEAGSRLTWRIDYLNDQGARRQTVLQSASPVSGIKKGGQQ
jgi:hypothetical protein